MGIPWSEDETGNDCGCWPEGYTPRYLYVSFIGIGSCPDAGALPPPPNGIFRLEQHGSNACLYFWVEPDFHIEWESGAGITALGATVLNDTFGAFGGTANKECVFNFSSIYDCAGWPFGPPYRGGDAVLFAAWNEPFTSLQSIAELFGLIKDEHSFCDFWPAEHPSVCFRYCRQRSPTNILMKVDMSGYDQYDMLERV